MRQGFLLALLVLNVLLAVAARAQAPCGGWAPGQGIPGVDGTVHAVAAWDPDGAGPRGAVTVVAGDFYVAGEVKTRSIAYWDGTAWGAFTQDFAGIVQAIAVDQTGSLIIGGILHFDGQQSGVARWNGSRWVHVGVGLSSGYTTPRVHALAVGNDGELYAGGTFDSIGGTVARRIARWDGSAWHAIGTGVGAAGAGEVLALAVLPSGGLFAGGTFTTAGDDQVTYLARWNGTAWVRVGSSGPSGVVRALTVGNFGHHLVVGGSFSSVDGIPAVGVGEWNGLLWRSWDGGAGGAVHALVRSQQGHVYAAGQFQRDLGSSSPKRRIARWDGVQWHALETGLDNTAVALASMPDGSVVAGGWFRKAGTCGCSGIARWGTGGWTTLGKGTNGAVLVLHTMADGGVIAGGEFSTIAGVDANNLARWDGENWEALGGGTNGPVRAAITLADGSLLIGGHFTSVNGTPIRGVARWDGQVWSGFGSGPAIFSAGVRALAQLPNGQIVVGGNFSFQFPRSIAAWNGSSWYALGGAGTDVPGEVTSLGFLPNGDLYAAGSFTTIGGIAANSIATWNGTAWSPVGAGFECCIYGAAVMPNGDIVVGHGQREFGYVSRWDGSQWTGLQLGMNGWATTFETEPEGTLLVGGSFTNAGGGPDLVGGVNVGSLARWDGQAWSAVGTGVQGTVRAIAALVDGRGLVGGDFYFAGNLASSYIAEWRSVSDDFDNDGVGGTDADIEAFFACLAGNCCATCWHLGSDFDGDGDAGTDADIEAFFRVLAGGAC